MVNTISTTSSNNGFRLCHLQKPDPRSSNSTSSQIPKRKTTSQKYSASYSPSPIPTIPPSPHPQPTTPSPTIPPSHHPQPSIPSRPRLSVSSSALKFCSSKRPSRRPQVSTSRISTGLKRMGLAALGSRQDTYYMKYIEN